MRGSFSIEASLIVPLVLAVMVLALRTGIDCYEETKAQVAKLGTSVSFDIVDTMDGTNSIQLCGWNYTKK